MLALSMLGQVIPGSELCLCETSLHLNCAYLGQGSCPFPLSSMERDSIYLSHSYLPEALWRYNSAQASQRHEYSLGAPMLFTP